MSKVPNSVRNLDAAIRRMTNEHSYVAVRTLISNALVGQMLPRGVVKGGTSLKLRFGNTATRFTTDLDAARLSTMEDFQNELTVRLLEGWNGFTGRIVVGNQAHPNDVPPCYVMQPLAIKLEYLGKSWCTVDLEVGHNEIGDAEEPDFVIPDEANRYLALLGFPSLSAVPLMPLHFQIAQKLHGVSEAGSKRVHDLIDLQIIVNEGQIDWRKTKITCERLFAYRCAQSWPPTVTEADDWEALYKAQMPSSGVLPSVSLAVEWVNGLICKIASYE